MLLLYYHSTLSMIFTMYILRKSWTLLHESRRELLFVHLAGAWYNMACYE